MNKKLFAVLTCAVILPSIAFAQTTPAPVATTQTTLTAPAFMQNVKSQADFDKLTPAQKQEMTDYLKAQAMADTNGLTPAQKAQIEGKPAPAPVASTTPSISPRIVMNVLIALAVLILIALGFIVWRVIVARRGDIPPSASTPPSMTSVLLFFTFMVSGLLIPAGQAKAATITDPSITTNQYSVTTDKMTYAPGEQITIFRSADLGTYSIGGLDFPLLDIMTASLAGQVVTLMEGQYWEYSPPRPTSATLMAPCTVGSSSISVIFQAINASVNYNFVEGGIPTNKVEIPIMISGTPKAVCSGSLPTASVSVSPNPVPYGGNPGFTLTSTNAIYCMVALDGASPFTQGFFTSGTYNPGAITTPGAHSAWAYCYNSDWVGSGWSVTNFTVNPAPTVQIQFN